MNTPFLDRLIENIRDILKGIDKDTCQDKDGWWETSTGAEFGAKKLKEIEYLVKNCSIPDIVFSESELKAKLEEQKDEIRQWLIDEDFEGLAERL